MPQELFASLDRSEREARASPERPGFIARHERRLWWIHSAWALAVGIGFVWLGARHYGYLRLAVFHIAFIWVTSLIVPALVSTRGRPARWRVWLKLALNYFNKNFYQQVIFFLLPLYYASSTWGSPNGWFGGLVATLAVLSTIDVLYEHYVSVRPGLAGVFFALNLFVCINVMLPVVWKVSNALALPVSAALALAAYATISYRVAALRRARTWMVLAVSAAVLSGIVQWGRPFIPPAPLRLTQAGFGTGFDRRTLTLAPAVSTLEPGWSGQLVALSSIHAPLGLKDRIAHRWYVNNRLDFSSGFLNVLGGRQEGFRVWTRHQVRPLPPGAVLRLDVVTEAGQLVGRASARVPTEAR